MDKNKIKRLKIIVYSLKNWYLDLSEVIDMKNLYAIIGLTCLLIIGFIIKAPMLKSKPIIDQRREEIKVGAAALVKDCEMTTFEGRLACFKDKIIENRKRNPQVPTEYQVIGSGLNRILKTEDLGNIIKIEKPREVTFRNCISNTLFFDWTEEFIHLSPDSFNSGAICDTEKGRVAIVPKSLSKKQILEFYELLNKKIN